MPPRHGKSEIASKYFPAWFIGRWPNKRVILCSYAADFAASWGRRARDIMEKHGPEFFGVSVRHDSSAADRWEVVGKSGGMITAGVGGQIVGRGADILICDDYLKNAEEAASPTIRERHREWWQSTAYTRLEPGGAAVIIATRWHEDDLIGWLLSQTKTGGDSWDVVNLPAIAEEDDLLGRGPGEALWPERFPVSELESIRRAIGSYYFSSQYGGRPQPAEGGTFKRSWFRYWDQVVAGDLYRLHRADGLKFVKVRDCRRFATVDLAFSLKQTADYTAIAAWAVTPDSDLLMLDMHRDRIDGPDLVPAITRMVHRHQLDYVGIEDVQAQTLVLKDARRKGLTVRALKADRDKVTRAVPAAIRMEAEQVFFPMQAPWLGDFESELLSFPTGAHDDMVDVCAYAAREIVQRGGAGETEEQKIERRKREEEDKRRRQEAWTSPTNPFIFR